MGQGISEVLPFAIAVAISPIPIVAVILVLFSGRAHVNATMFLAGWVVGLGVLATVVYLVADAANVGSSSSASDTVSWGKVGLGILLLALARRNWAKRPAPGETPALPKWMGAIESLTPGRAAAAGVALGGVNPKNLVLTVAAAGGLAQLGLATGDAVVALVVFVVVASLSIGGAVCYSLFGGEGARSHLDDLKAWMDLHSSAVMAVLFLVFGVVLISQGLDLLSR